MDCKMAEGSLVGEHVVKMIGYAERLKTPEFPLPPDHMMDMLLSSLPPSYDGFIMNYNMSGMEKTPEEVLAMLKTTEGGLRKNLKQVLLVNKTASFKRKASQRRARAPVRPSPKAILRAESRMKLSASTARAQDTGRETARSIWKLRSPRKSEKV